MGLTIFNYVTNQNITSNGIVVFGCFGGLYWCGIGENDSLLSYAKRLRRMLAENGIPFDRKKFSPHITLIRRAEYDQRRGFPGVDIPNASMQISGALLMCSDRTKSGMVYTSVSADHI